MRNRRNYTLLWGLLVVLLIAVISLMGWQNYRFATNNRGGNEFLVQWTATRNFLANGISPYSEETLLKIQTAAYGRPAEKNEPQLRFAYPLYSIAALFPFALIPDYNTARAAYMTVLEIALILLLAFSIRLTRWRLGLLDLVLFVLFSLFWYHSVRPLLDGNVAILVALFMVSGLLALKNGGDELAGVLFAFATIKPNLSILLIIFVIIWSLSTGRTRVLAWLFGSLFLLSASTALLLPDWIVQNFRAIVTYPIQNPPSTLGTVLASSFPAMGERIARILYGILAGMVVTEWVLNRHAEFRGFLWTALFSLTVGQWIGVPTSPQNFIILLPAVALVFATWEERWRRFGRVLTIVSMLLLFLGIWTLVLNFAGIRPLLQNRLLFLPLPGFLLITLYWVRWWAIRPPSVWFDLIYMQENPRIQ